MTAPSPAASSPNGRIHTPVPDRPLRTHATSQPQVQPFSFTTFCPFLVFLGIILGTFTNPRDVSLLRIFTKPDCPRSSAPLPAVLGQHLHGQPAAGAFCPPTPTPGSSVSSKDGFSAALRTTLLDNHLLPAFCFSFLPFSFKLSQNQGHTLFIFLAVSWPHFSSTSKIHT